MVVAYLGATILAVVAAAILTARIARTPAPPEPAPYRLRYRVDWPKEPWRNRADADRVVTVPLWWLHTITDPGELAAAATHLYRLDQYEPSIARIGIACPLMVNIDQLGRVCLADGHHRLVIATSLGLDVCPVIFTAVTRIGGYGVPAGPAVISLLTQTPDRVRALTAP